MFRGTGRAFTFVEMLVVLAVIGILAAILIPAVSATRRKARRTECQNQLRRLGLGFHLYASVNDQLFPHEDAGSGGSPPQGTCWFDVLDPHLRVRNLSRLKQCPTFDGEKDWHSYKMNSLLERSSNHFYRLGSSPDESRTILLFDARTDSVGNRKQTKGTKKSAAPLHDNGTNVLFVDGGVFYHEPEWNPDGGWADAGPFIWDWRQ